MLNWQQNDVFFHFFTLFCCCWVLLQSVCLCVFCLPVSPPPPPPQNTVPNLSFSLSSKIVPVPVCVHTCALLFACFSCAPFFLSGLVNNSTFTNCSFAVNWLPREIVFAPLAAKCCQLVKLCSTIWLKVAKGKPKERSGGEKWPTELVEYE